MRRTPRFLAIVSYIFQAAAASKQGRGGIALVLLTLLWDALAYWQLADFLWGRMTPLVEFLSSPFATLVLVLLGFVFLYRAVSARWPDSKPSAKADEKRSVSEPPENEGQPRRFARQLLGEAAARGRDLQTFGHFDAATGEPRVNTEAERKRWVDLTRAFLEDAFDKSVAAQFMSAGDYKVEGLAAEDNFVKTHNPYFMPVRVWRIDQIAANANSLEVNLDCDPQDWEGRFNSR